MEMMKTMKSVKVETGKSSRQRRRNIEEMWKEKIQTNLLKNGRSGGIRETREENGRKWMKKSKSVKMLFPSGNAVSLICFAGCNFVADGCRGTQCAL